MDSFSLERIPLPSFTVYLISSLITLSAAIFNIVRDDWNQSKNFSSVVNNSSGDESASWRCFQMFDKCLEDTWCFWSLTNFGYGCLMSLALKLQNTIFGQLTENEQTHIRDRFWNFVFYKIIFMYGVLKVQSIQQITLWIAWSSVLGFLYLLSGLLKDRLEFVLHIPATSPVLHLKMTFLLLSVLALAIFLAGISLAVGLKVSLQIMFFMFAEVFQLFTSAMHTGTRYCLHFYLETQSSTQDAKNTLHHSIIFYHVDLFFDVLERVVDLIHNIHMLFWNWLQINMSGLIVCLHLQYLYFELSKILKRHRRYCEVAEILSTKISLVYTQEKCAVCWDVLSPGRQLRCGHVFHDACLRSWFGHMPTCPTCRANIPELGPSRGDVIHQRELYATGSPNVASPAGHIPSPLSLTSEQQRRLQAAQPTTTADSSSIRNVSENGVSLAVLNADATFGSRSHQLGSGLSGVVAQLTDELSMAFAALNNRSGVDSSTMQHVSTTVIVNNLVDARRDILSLHSLGNSDLPVKFLGELEAELAIRVLLLRAGQAAEAAHCLRSVNRHRHRGKTSVCSASSAFCGELPAGECNILSPPVLEEPLKPCVETPAILEFVPSCSGQEVNVGQAFSAPTDYDHHQIRSGETLLRNYCPSTENRKERMNQLLSNARRCFLKKYSREG